MCPPPAPRLEFDAYRADLEELSLGPRDAVTLGRIETAQHEYQVHKDKYERLRSDVSVKLKFLEENKVRGGAALYSSPPPHPETACSSCMAKVSTFLSWKEFCSSSSLSATEELSSTGSPQVQKVSYL